MCLAVPGKVISMTGGELFSRKGKVEFNGIIKEVSLAYVPEIRVGDYVMVHVGFAISKVDEKEAKQVFKYLEEMEELKELDIKQARENRKGKT
ncbi:MAG TPA: HypC/HybG/HupF family hydrogenase formation chaperone [Candidatus Omnitrophota bacterium]|nr:HypC/HybG/HupF family hydrogenase formation chaperone [Candidatus Omnitrophota bacterium]HPD84917.1 HypC/HybG/HupF family hydrogenase formation chaperone [Candidatus Omnitrophota bacterium]HRZ03775.1 HypC/HybG/HupF family hydrogenase formation chaperone [Candidatus Omnitrophota bacterium]